MATFEKPENDFLHLKPLYLRGYINGKPISRMLVDGGVSVNLIPWSTCKKLSVQAEELVKTNMILSDFMGGGQQKPKESS